MKQILENPIPDLRAILPRATQERNIFLEFAKTLDTDGGCGTISVPSALVISLKPADR
jgi:hypothetical protein